jgi:thiamine monophosphate synthase
LSAERAKIQLHQLRDKDNLEDERKKLQRIQEEVEQEREKLKEER